MITYMKKVHSGCVGCHWIDYIVRGFYSKDDTMYRIRTWSSLYPYGWVTSNDRLKSELTHRNPPTSSSTSAAAIFCETVNVLLSTTLIVPASFFSETTFENWYVYGYGVSLGITMSLEMSGEGGNAEQNIFTISVEQRLFQRHKHSQGKM